MGPPLGPQTCRTPLVPPTSVDTIVRLCGSSTSGGRNKDSPTTAAKCWIVSAVKGGSELGDVAMAESTRWLIRPGCLSRSHPDVAHRIPASSASSFVSSFRSRRRRCGRKKGEKRREMAGLLDQIFNHRSASWPGCEDEAGRRSEEMNHRGKKKKKRERKEIALSVHSCSGRLSAPFKLEH